MEGRRKRCVCLPNPLVCRRWPLRAYALSMDSVPSQPAEPQCPVTPDDPISEEAYDAVIAAMDQMIAEAPEPVPAELPPHTAAERRAILVGLDLDPDDPACHARAIVEGLIRTDPPFVSSPWPRPPRDERT